MDIKNNPRHMEKKSVTEQAAEWLMVLEDKGVEANPAFSDWLRESPTHVQAYLRAATLDTLLKRVDAERSIGIARPEPGEWTPDISPELSEDLLEARPAGAKRTAWRAAAGFAAAGVLIALTLDCVRTDLRPMANLPDGHRRTAGCGAAGRVDAHTEHGLARAGALYRWRTPAASARGRGNLPRPTRSFAAVQGLQRQRRGAGDRHYLPHLPQGRSNNRLSPRRARSGDAGQMPRPSCPQLTAQIAAKAYTSTPAKNSA